MSQKAKKFFKKLERKSKHSLGFTLLELLTVVAIISILVTIVVMSVITARVRGRDTKRKGDAQSLAGAFQMYANDNLGKFPEPPGSVNCGKDQNGNPIGVCLAFSSCDPSNPFPANILEPTYLEILPKDPKNSNNYCYWYGYNYINTGTIPSLTAPSYVIRFSQENTVLDPNYIYETGSTNPKLYLKVLGSK